MTISYLKSLFQTELNSIYPKNEIDSFYHILTEFKLGISRVDKALNPGQEVNEDAIVYFKNAISLLYSEKPIQYITEETEFYGLTFKVNKNVLIPRPETEELVNWIIENSDPNKEISILDIGTGSGCIAISLAKNITKANVTAIDFSKPAINIALKNAKKNGVSIEFIKQDILKADSLTKNFDIIVSNPPYVRELEKQEINNNVLSFEPHSALFVTDNNALVFYRKIADLSINHLKPNGKLFFEINQYLGKETLEMLTKKGFTLNKLKKDIFGNDRMIMSQNPKKRS
ncbi:peptide chain release factor N(5)-glutamine methyltransferase [Flavicella sp.]|uniref:peptide chain release factor N(5)-glutamine methyltransferase n=1 Tax=Flavicella sp. TaxID=2957742 RepID=UPI003018717A